MPALITPIDYRPHELDDPVFCRDDASGFWYACGRMDQGQDALIALEDNPTMPSIFTTARRFGILWARDQAEFRNPHGRGGAFPGMPSAWENFVESRGESIAYTGGNH